MTANGAVATNDPPVYTAVRAWLAHPNQSTSDSIGRYWKRMHSQQGFPASYKLPANAWTDVVAAAWSKLRDADYLRRFVGFAMACERTWTPEAIGRWIATETLCAELVARATANQSDADV